MSRRRTQENTIRSEVVVAHRKPLKDKRGLTTLKAKILNQDDEEVLEIEYRITVQTRSRR